LALFQEKGPFWAFLLDPASPARCVLHQPLAAGPCNPKIGVFRVPARGRPGSPILGLFSPKSPFSGDSGLGPREGAPGARGGDRAPARGVDVKPPSAGRSPGRPGLARALEGPDSRIPGREPCRDPSGPFRGALEPLPGTPRGLVLHQPLAAGPCPRPGDPVVAPGPGPRTGV